jgi:hypothetical protein
MTGLALLYQLYERGIILTPSPEGTVCCRAPKGVLTLALMDVMRQYKLELHALVEVFEERAAMAEYGGGLSRPAAEQLAWQYVLGHPPEQQPRTAVLVP